MRNFDSLSEREILALAISLEEEDERIYADFAEGLRQDFPASAAVFDGMRAGCLVAAGVSAAGAILAAALLPAQPLRAAPEQAGAATPALGSASTGD